MSNELEKYWDFVAARHAIWQARRRGAPAPWTTDPVMARWSLTNVYRQLDPGTRYAVGISSDADSYYSPASKLFNLLCYRCMGRESTYRYLVEQREGIWLLPIDMRDEQQELVDSLVSYRDVLGKPVFSTAYMVPSFDWAPGETKVEKIVWQWTDWASGWAKTFQGLASSTTGLQFYSRLKALPGIGRFLASQVYVDCTYQLPSIDDCTLLDWQPAFYDDFMVPGPGALTGLQRLFGSSVPPTDRVALAAMIDLRDQQEVELTRRGFEQCTRSQLGMTGEELVPLSLQDVQNTLCEFGKYRKIQDGTGKARRKYSYELSHEARSFSEQLHENPSIELSWVNSSPDSTERWYFASHEGDDVGRTLASIAGYRSLEWTHEKSGIVGHVVVVPVPDASKYDPADGVNDPIAELENHLTYGLGERVQPVLTVNR